MADKPEAKPLLPGVYDRRQGAGMGPVDIAGLGVAVVWLVVSSAYFLFGGGIQTADLRFLLVLMVIFFPVALIWVAVLSARNAAMMRLESARLQAAVDALRNAYVAQAQKGAVEVPNPVLLKRLDEIAARQKNFETTFAMAAATRTAASQAAPVQQSAPVAQAADDQPALSLGTPAEALQPPLSNVDFIRALHFPETAEDTQGFNALRRALRDRRTAQLVQAAKDVLTLLSQEGIYMDDLRPELARAEVWRAFARGERGRAIAPLGGIRDRSSIALATARMKQDPIFRDAAHHFLRLFDRNFAQFETGASDAEIGDFSMTRSARAFMLLGRVAGTFD